MRRLASTLGACLLVGLACGQDPEGFRADGDALEPAAPPGGGEQAPGPEKLSRMVRRRGRAVSLPVADVAQVRKGDHVDLLASLVDPLTKQLAVVTLLQNCLVLEVEPAGTGLATGAAAPGRVTLLLVPEEAEVGQLVARTGTLHLTLRDPEDIAVQEERARATIESLLTGERARVLDRLRRERLGESAPQASRLPHGKLRALPLTVSGGHLAVPGDRLDLIATLQDPRTGQAVAVVVLEDAWVLEGGAGDRLVLQVLPEEAELLVAAAGLGQLSAALRHPEDPAREEERGRATLETVLTGERVRSLQHRRMQVIQVIRLGAGGGGMSAGVSGGGGGDAAQPAGEPAPTAWRPSGLPSHAVRLRVGDEAFLPLRGVEARVRVDGFRARVVLDLLFENDQRRQLEGDLQLRLPEDARPSSWPSARARWVSGSPRGARPSPSPPAPSSPRASSVPARGAGRRRGRPGWCPARRPRRPTRTRCVARWIRRSWSGPGRVCSKRGSSPSSPGGSTAWSWATTWT